MGYGVKEGQLEATHADHEDTTTSRHGRWAAKNHAKPRAKYLLKVSWCICTCNQKELSPIWINFGEYSEIALRQLHRCRMVQSRVGRLTCRWQPDCIL